MSIKNKQAGYTILEIMLAAALGGVLILGVVKLSLFMFTFTTRGQARQLATMEGRRCMETIERTLSIGRANTLVVSTPSTTPMIPRSQAQFSVVEGSTVTLYSIRWSDTPMNTVYLRRSVSGVVQDSVIGTHVTALIFDLPDAADPSLVNVSLQITVPLGSQASKGRFYTINLPNKSIEMIAS